MLSFASFLFVASLLSFASLSLHGEPLPIPDSLFSAPDTAYFGLTRVGSCDTLPLPITNSGADPLIIDSVLFVADSSSLFLIDGMKGVLLSAGSTQSIRVGFCPDDTSCVAGSMLIYGHVEGVEGSAILHQIRIGGCGGASFIKVEKQQMEFGSVLVSECRQDSFRVTNTGNYPLRISGMSLSNPEFRIVQPTQFPITLSPYSSRTIVVEFCPLKVGAIFDSLLIFSDADNEIPPLYLIGQSRFRQLFVPSLFDVGSVPVGGCIDTFLVVKNSGTVPITLTGIWLAALPLPSGFSLADQFPSGWQRILSPEETMRIYLRFCPTIKGEILDSIRITDEDNGVYLTRMQGRGFLPFVRLDTVDGVAGEIVTLTFRSGPGDLVGPGAYSVQLLFNPDALFPVSAASATPGGSVNLSRPGKGIALIEGNRSDPLSSDGSLFTISFRGLSSGELLNRVEIESLEFPTSLAWDTLHGMVRLSGCEVGRTPGTGKRAHINSMGPNPASENILLNYQAPQGRTPSLTLFDARGGRVKSIALPQGTGGAQEFRLDLADLPRGFYTMELREREERSWSILLIDR